MLMEGQNKKEMRINYEMLEVNEKYYFQNKL